ncbi:MAG: ATP-binding cassette domain-containing protein [Ferruginibacter sp.]
MIQKNKEEIINYPIPVPSPSERGCGEAVVRLDNLGKRYNREWIFRHFNYEFVQGKTYAITGSNGSGKSTLLQVIAGAVLHSEGNIDFTNGKKEIANETIYQQLSFAAPYLELIEEMNAVEFLNFHSTFKPLTESVEFILLEVGLAAAANKQIRYYSTGMKQRLKLAQAFFSKTNILLLDEPTTNLDAEGIVLYHHLINDYTKEKLVLVSSNDKHEYEFCTDLIDIADYK